MSWAMQNYLNLNVGKTKAIVISTPYYINRLPLEARTYVDIGGARVVYESSLRNLGVVLDSKLSWKEHLAHVSRSVHSIMYRLYYLGKNQSEATSTPDSNAPSSHNRLLLSGFL